MAALSNACSEFVTLTLIIADDPAAVVHSGESLGHTGWCDAIIAVAG